jgi:hypothetical protein
MSGRYFWRSPAAFLLPLALVGLAASWLIPRCSREAPGAAHSSPGSGAPSALAPPRPAYSPARPALTSVTPDPRLPRSPLADTLHSPTQDPREDLVIIGQMLGLYRERFDAYPAFETNAQLVNALAGANPERIGLLPRDHPAISAADGQLLDRWGSPYHAHALGRDALELRSAGPDRVLYTADDLLLPVGGSPTPDAAALP